MTWKTQQLQKSLKNVCLSIRLSILVRFATSLIIIVVCQYLNRTKSEWLAGVVLSNNTKKIRVLFCSPWKGHLNFPIDSVVSYSTYLGNYYVIENYIFPFTKRIIEKKKSIVMNFLIYLNDLSLAFLKTLQILKKN